MKYTYEIDKLSRKIILVYTNCESYLNILKKRYYNIDKNKNSFDINRYNKDKFDLKETDYLYYRQILNKCLKKILLLNHCLIDNKYEFIKYNFNKKVCR